MMPAEYAHWSYSQMNQFLRICPLQYAFQRIYGLSAESVSESLPFGSAIHRTAEFLWAKRMDGKDATQDELAEMFALIWKREVQDTPNLQYHKSDFDSLLKQGQDMIRVYRQQFPDDIDIAGYNVPFKVPLIDRHGELLERPLVGEIDLLIRHGDRLCAVDLKTSGQRYSDSKLTTDLQPTVYLYALRMMEQQNAFFRWDVLLKNKTPLLVQYPAERTQEDFRRMVDLVKRMDEMIQAGLFLPNDGSYFCGNCGYQNACKDWHLNTPCHAASRPQLVTVGAGS